MTTDDDDDDDDHDDDDLMIDDADDEDNEDDDDGDGLYCSDGYDFVPLPATEEPFLVMEDKLAIATWVLKPLFRQAREAFRDTQCEVSRGLYKACSLLNHG